MSLFMDAVDCAFIKSLFPKYLLEQPIAHDLWNLYFSNRKLFHKLRSKGDSICNVVETRFKPNQKLSYETRKDIWERLVTLGVVGTVPFESASDEYLIQVYQYFFPNIDASGAHRVLDPESAGSNMDNDTSDMLKPVDPILTGRRSDDEDDNEMQEDEDDDDNDGEDDDEDDGDDEDVFHSDNERQSDAAGPQHGNSESPHSEELEFFPTVSESMHSSESKGNPISPEIYKYLNYPLPYAWLSQPTNSVLLSSDGSSQLKPNPNWHNFAGYDRAGSAIGGSLRTNFTYQKYEYATTWSNNSIAHQKVAIFYYEIKVLSVTSSQSGHNSNIIVGFKENAKLQNVSASPSRSELQNEAASINRQSTSILRSTLESTSSGSHGGGSTQGGKGSGFDKGSYGYCGTDGYITDGVQYKSFGKPFGRDDVIGCGVNYVDGTIFFTKNGVNLGTAFTDVNDIDFVPYIALRPGNSVKTNFGIYEEFLFDLMSYQNMYKVKAYQHIFQNFGGGGGSDDFDVNEIEDDSEESPVNDQEDHDMLTDGFLLPADRRFSGDKLCKPEIEKLNSLSSTDDSISCAMNTMINEFLIHEGLIDVAKGFLVDLRKDCIPDSDEERARLVIRHNEKQIMTEEKNLRIRQDIRRLISAGSIEKCLKYIEGQFPGLLDDNVDLLFELRIAEYLIAIVNLEKHSIEFILQMGKEISQEFVHDNGIPADLRESFQSHLSEISLLLAYDNPLEECSEDLAVFLTPSYLQDRLFQLVNSRVLTFLKKKSESSLENMVSYTRAMVKVLSEFGDVNEAIFDDTDVRHYKLVNIDEDLLNL
ncbi:LAMI_0D02278g1_1 [Lachancea mirantina]|uniref:LAMI_0D02278g1_1 n=1 Tax=Lachancea mirantina TaxID=1230905 RepID=A0A1G4J9Q8_9SACH|nr:LAMI_0D02278g1_1 [Lachancea mirantina]